jgi:adenine-specific DNA-methyltransferase
MVSYSNLGKRGVKTSHALIPEKVIIETLKEKGSLKIFSISHKPFSAGRSKTNNHKELIYFCKVK